jgi:hypothetical protein
MGCGRRGSTLESGLSDRQKRASKNHRLIQQAFVNPLSIPTYRVGLGRAHCEIRINTRVTVEFVGGRFIDRRTVFLVRRNGRSKCNRSNPSGCTGRTIARGMR